MKLHYQGPQPQGNVSAGWEIGTVASLGEIADLRVFGSEGLFFAGMDVPDNATTEYLSI